MTTVTTSYTDYVTEGFDQLLEISKDPTKKMTVILFESIIQKQQKEDSRVSGTTASIKATYLPTMLVGNVADTLGIVGSAHTFYKEGFKFDSLHQYTQLTTGTGRLFNLIGRIGGYKRLSTYGLLASTIADFVAFANKVYFTPVYNKVNGI